MKTQISSELVGNVAHVHVTVGERIPEGHEVALLESMKMEIPLLSPVAGTVVAVHVSPGDVVQEGDVMVEVE